MSALVASARAIADDIAAGRVSAVEVCREALDRIARVNASLNAFRDGLTRAILSSAARHTSTADTRPAAMSLAIVRALAARALIR